MVRLSTMFSSALVYCRTDRLLLPEMLSGSEILIINVERWWSALGTRKRWLSTIRLPSRFCQPDRTL